MWIQRQEEKMDERDQSLLSGPNITEASTQRLMNETMNEHLKMAS